MSITIKECFYKDKKFKGLYEIEPEIYKDNRGEFCEIFSEKEFKKKLRTIKGRSIILIRSHYIFFVIVIVIFSFLV